MTADEQCENDRRAAAIAEEGRRRAQAIMMTENFQQCLSACAWIREVAGEPHYMTESSVGWHAKNGDISVEWLERDLSGAPAGHAKYHIMSATPIHGGLDVDRWYKSGTLSTEIKTAVYEMIARSGNLAALAALDALHRPDAAGCDQ